MNGKTTQSPGLDPETPLLPSEPTAFAVVIALAVSLFLVFLTRLPVGVRGRWRPTSSGSWSRSGFIGSLCTTRCSWLRPACWACSPAMRTAGSWCSTW